MVAFSYNFESVTEYTLGVVFLCLFIGAVILWRHTKRISAMAQAMSAGLVFLTWVIREISGHFTTPYGSSPFSRVMWSESLRTTLAIVDVTCGLVFALSYVLYAVARKKI
jgi:hypothetical protein